MIRNEIELQVIQPKDGPTDGGFDCLLYDLDCLPPQMAREVLAEMLACSLPRPVALHSYNLDDSQVEALRSNGVFVSRQLEAELLASIRWIAEPATARRTKRRFTESAT